MALDALWAEVWSLGRLQGDKVLTQQEDTPCPAATPFSSLNLYLFLELQNSLIPRSWWGVATP